MTDENVIAALSADQVAKLTGLTARQLAYWDATGFFRPQYAAENRRSPHSRIYSFKDIVGLRTISVLMHGYNVTMPHLKEVAKKLSEYTSHPWSDVKLAVWNREVTWIDPEMGRPTGVISRQYVLFELIDVIEDMRQKTLALRTRDDADVGRVARSRNVAHNRVVFSGTRIPVDAVLSFSDAGYSTEAILKEYPSLKPEDIEAAQRERASRAVA